MARLPPRHDLTRRTFLVGSLGAGAAVLLAACGGDDARGGGEGSNPSTGEAGAGAFTVMVRRFPPNTLVPGRQRVPVSVGTTAGLLAVADAPAELVGRVLDEKGTTVVVDEVRAVRHGDGLPAAYYPFQLAIDTPGFYTLDVEGDGSVTTVLDVVEPAKVAIPLVGAALPPFATPTLAEPGGVDPICTASPPCPLHAQTLTDALASGRPVAYLIGTPAHCQTAVCGPVLDLLVAEHEVRGEAIAMVHAEVYTNNTIQTVAPAVEAYDMTFEPALFVADASGTIVERLDAVWDGTEQAAALDRVS